MALKQHDDLALLQQLLLDCVCAQLNEAAELVDDYPGCPGCVYPVGGEPAWDFCAGCQNGTGCGGQLNTWVPTMYPYTNWPLPMDGTERPVMGRGTTCPPPAGFAAEVAVTLLRCAPMVDLDGDPPPPTVQAAHARLTAIDLQAVMQAIPCCLDSLLLPGRRKPFRYVLGTGTVITPDGGCSGVEVRVTVDLGRLCPCPPAPPTAGAGADVPLSASTGTTTTRVAA